MEAGQMFGIVIAVVSSIIFSVLIIISAVSNTKENRKKHETQFADLKGDILRLEKELEKQKEYFEARLFLEKFEWEDIKNEKLRKEIKQKVNKHAEHLFMYSKYYSPTQELIDRVEIIKEALEKDKEITGYIGKENKTKKEKGE